MSLNRTDRRGSSPAETLEPSAPDALFALPLSEEDWAIFDRFDRGPVEAPPADGGESAADPTWDVDAPAPEASAAAQAEAEADRWRVWPHGLVEWFAIAQTAIPALLFLPGSQAVRLPIRMGVYGLALAGLALWWLRGPRITARHPADRWLWLVAAWLAIMVFHPLTSSTSGGIAQTALYVAVFSACLWTPASVHGRSALVRVLAILLVCNGLNALVGILQVYDPDRWMPPELSFAFTQNRNALDAATYVGADGRRIVRPPGLFDTPGAVCGPGTVAAVLGLVFALEPFKWWQRLGALGLSGAGLAAIYLSHVRANFVITIGMMLVYGVLLVLQRRPRRASLFAGLCAALLVGAFLGSSLLGGESIAERFSTLLDEDPRTVYYNNRGNQLATGFSELSASYPLGAGLARWGMMRNYFGDPSNLESTALWAEVQPTAWVIDGGLVLVALYGLALIAVVGHQWRLVQRLPDPDDRLWTAAVMAVNAGTIALVFSFVPFNTQVGLQFWFLEGVLHGALTSRAEGDQ